jgi:hypothetical protein
VNTEAGATRLCATLFQFLIFITTIHFHHRCIHLSDEAFYCFFLRVPSCIFVAKYLVAAVGRDVFSVAKKGKGGEL